MPTIDQLFHEALEHAPDERAAFVEQACAGDVALAREVLELLAAHAEADDFMQRPAALDGLGRGQTDPRLGRELGPYRLLDRVGSGGMGAVYRAERADRQFEQQVAIKVIKAGLDSEQMLARFRYERQVLANLVHPNIARLLDGGAVDDTPYIVMEYVDGVRIDRFCDERRMPVPERLELFLTVCAAVEHAHANLVVHRDLKPANILVTADGTAKLLDFGIAKVIDPGQGDIEVTAQAERRLTLAYASPQLIAGAAPTTEADVYSLGVILYELVTGHHPRPRDETRASGLASPDTSPRSPEMVVTMEEPAADGTTHTVAQIAAARSTEPAVLRRVLRGDVSTIALTAIRHDPSERYTSVARLAEDVRRHLDGRPILARAPRLRDHVRSFARRNPRLMAVGAAAALALLAATVVVVVSTASAIESGRAAARQARIARLVNDFLNDDVLGAVDPDVTSDPNITIRDALDHAATRLDGAFPDEPLVEAALRATVGETYHAVGAMADGERHLRLAVDLYRAHAGATDPVTLEARAGWVATLTELNDLDRAVTESRDLVRTLDEHLGIDAPLAARARRSLAVALMRQDRLDESSAVLEELLARQRAAELDPTSTLHQLGRLRRLQSRLDEAAALIVEVIERRAAALGPESPSTLEARSLLGSIRQEQGRREEALAIAEALLEIRRTVLGPEHPSTLRSLNNVGLRLVRLKRYEEAEPVLREAFESIRRRRGPDHLHALTAADNLAQALAYLGRYDDAIPLRNDTLDRSRASLGPDHRQTLIALGNLATTLRMAGRAEEALPHHEEAVATARRALAEGHWHVGAYLIGHVQTLLAVDRAAEAEPLLLEALAIYEGHFEPGHPRIATAWKTAVRLYEALGRADEAARYRVQ